MKAKIPATLAMLFFGSLGSPAWAADEQKFVFETWTKQKIEAFGGSFEVPENRNAEGSRMIPIKYVRLRATGNEAGPPIVYLAGGPGGSGIAAIQYRLRMFMAMRKHGDVIALDQRGTGASNVVPRCQSKQAVPTTTVTSDEDYVRYHRQALQECLEFWRQNGVDLAGYNTIENAHDLEALRVHLGAEKIVLWGTSYGSHLALAALREIEGSIAKVVISSAEGLDQTIKLPLRFDAYLTRLQAAVGRQPAAKAAYPDIKALMRRVHAQLDRKPVLVKLKNKDGAKVDYLLQRRDMQLLAASLCADPRSAAILLNIYRQLDRGSLETFERVPARLLPDNLADPGGAISFDGMPVAMDIASGMTRKHQAVVAEQATKAIVGPYLDPTFHFDGMAPELDLGDAFRRAPVSSVPVLVLSGTLDGRTFIESQRKAVSGLENASLITVRNAGHNLFDESSSELQEAIDRFMEGKPGSSTATIAIELPDLAPM
ncbi:MAG TPA: alpha/beta hydrolase [Steroidobacter sp.]|uniref:alpha/beta hydrolase n=1 Tax=Steroidobacter sp. TaxID=1978227 RepID=UPI002ED89A00